MSVTPSCHHGDAESYRQPMIVTHLRIFRETSYFICPRCWRTLEREYVAYCDRCGQCLAWKNLTKVKQIWHCH